MKVEIQAYLISFRMEEDLLFLSWKSFQIKFLLISFLNLPKVQAEVSLVCGESLPCLRFLLCARTWSNDWSSVH